MTSEEQKFLNSLGLNIDKGKMEDAAREERRREGKGCSLCDYQGFTVGEDGKSYFCVCSKRKSMGRLCQEAQIPQAYWHKTLDDWSTQQDANGYDLGPQRKLSEKIRALFAFYSQNIGNIVGGHPPVVKRNGLRERLHSLVLEGGNGSGKTFLIAIAMQAALQKGYTAYFMEWSDLIDICRSFHKDDEQDMLRDVFQNYDLVAIDNATAYEGLPNHCIIQLDRFCRARVNSGKPVLIGTEAGWQNINAGSGWRSLVGGCCVISLPRIENVVNTRL